jgi:hypothetical protein
MRPTFRKLEVKDIGDLERLVAENVEGIEPGLKVVDSRLLLGQAAIDLVGLDAKGSLVLIALDFTADEGLLLRVMDAYSWCLEFPDAIRRLYPMAHISQIRPPRILFIVERLTDSFVRRIKQLSFLEIDCLEFRHLEVNGASALYFDLVQRLRRAEAPAAAEGRPGPAPAPSAPDVPRVTVDLAPTPAPLPAPEPPVIVPEPPLAGPVVLEVEPEPVTVAPAPSVEEPAVEASPTIAAEPPLVEHASPAPALVLESVDSAARQTHEPTPAPSVNGTRSQWQARVDDLGVEDHATTPAPSVREEAPAAEPEPTARVASEPAETSVPPVQPPAWAKSTGQSVAGPNRAYFFAQAVKGNAPAETPAAAAPAVVPEARAAVEPRAEAPSPAVTPEEPAKAVGAPPAAAEEPRPELEALNFPKDGLSRQWLEFLNQLSATK